MCEFLLDPKILILIYNFRTYIQFFSQHVKLTAEVLCHRSYIRLSKLHVKIFSKFKIKHSEYHKNNIHWFQNHTSSQATWGMWFFTVVKLVPLH